FRLNLWASWCGLGGGSRDDTHGFAFEIASDGIGGPLDGAPAGGPSGPTEMRREDGAWCTEQWVVCRRRFNAEHIGCEATELTAVESIENGVFVDKLAASCIDQ